MTLTGAETYPISVVIPAHNAAEQLKLCLGGLKKNDPTGVEILVVDDASDDATPQVVADFAREWGRPGAGIECLRLRKRSGPAGARNKGLERARSPHVLFVDADVVLPPRSIEWIRETLDLYSHRSDIAGVLGSYSTTIPCNDFLSNFKNLYVCHLYKRTNTLSPYLHTPIICIKRDILSAFGGFNSGLQAAEDFHLGTMLGSEGYRFVIDRRLRGIHLKRYTLGKVLKEDWKRIRDLRAVRPPRIRLGFTLRAHRVDRLVSLAIPGLALLGGVWSLWNPNYLPVILFLIGVFYLCNSGFLIYCLRQRGLGFALAAALFVFVEMLWAEISLMGSLLALR